MAPLTPSSDLQIQVMSLLVPEKTPSDVDITIRVSSAENYDSNSSQHRDHTHRRLKNRHIQLIGISGTIGTALFVQIGSALSKGGPGSLVVAFTLWSTVILALNNCLAEMVTWIPISSPFIRYADHFVDPALGFCAGINYFLYQAFLIPFEIVAINLILHFWTDKIPIAAVVATVVVLYGTLNVIAVKYYGESEFWLSLGKVILAVGLILFTFVTMVGGNPQHDVYGFRTWDPSKVAGAPFAQYIETGSLGRFLGFLACLIQASFTMSGPDYVSMTAGETEFPRRTLPKAFKAVYWRLSAFFVLGALCVGLVIPYSDPDLLSALSNPKPGAGSSPYVIAMEHLGIDVLPHIVNVLILTSVFSAGNGYVFVSSRSLLGLALEGKAPRFLTRCNANGVPIYCVAVVLSISLLAFLQVSNDSAVVLQWIVNLVTASQLLNFAIICFTYIRFHKAMSAQKIDRDNLPYRALFQPYCGYYGLVATLIMACVGGYTVFLPGRWSVTSFIFSYTMIGFVPLLFVVWKIYHNTQWRRLEEISFFTEERAKVDEYEDTIEREIKPL